MSAKKTNPIAMLVDDNEIDNFINQKMLEGCGFTNQVYVHTTARSALEFLKNIDRNEEIPAELAPEIIFLDINMPMLDGFQFIDEFEKMSEKVTKNTKIVMLTTSVNPADEERSMTIKRIIKFINKPLTEGVLKELKKLISEQKQPLRA